MTSAIDTDVLIVGAGPTGLMLANQLARRGIRLMIIDRHAGPARETRALGVQARTLEIYQHLGIVDAALALGKAPSRQLLGPGEARGPHPPGRYRAWTRVLSLPAHPGQDDNERLLGENLRTLGREVQWNTELVGLAQDAEASTATLKQPDGSMREAGPHGSPAATARAAPCVN